MSVPSKQDLARDLGAGRQVVQSVERAQQRRLTGSGRPDQAGHAILGDVEGAVANGRAAVERDGDVLQLHRGRAALASCSVGAATSTLVSTSCHEFLVHWLPCLLLSRCPNSGA